MILNIIKIIYCEQTLFVPYVFGKAPCCVSELYFPQKMDSNKFLAFESLVKAKETIAERGIQYNECLQEIINIDNIAAWINGDHIAVNMNEINELNTVVFNYIIYTYDAVMPKCFDGHSDHIIKLIQAYISIIRSNLYAGMKESNPKAMENIPEIEMISDEEINLLLNNSELKKEVGVRLSFFKDHISIVKD